MSQERIKLGMSVSEIVMVMSEGNPGAIQACMEILKKGEKVDPEAFAGGLSHLLLLDTLGIWGERLYKLWNDVCKRNVGWMIALLRAQQLGLAGINKETLNFAIDNRGAGVDLDAVVTAVKNHLSNFNPEAV